ncbi:MULTISPECIES: acyl-CoA synthetase [Kordiimonas]|jgi:fatty-acyl-CoA synthase|uniref:acyl-CoA synthetase n=1 Tax=Kordiimonas TaxID=288021 RepID=UPI002580A139|nr:acyl-CoA synthetase [Kordiimonas sp. UBA4487]
MMKLSTIKDIQAVEAVPLDQQPVPASTYSVFEASAKKFAAQPALSLMTSTEKDAPVITLDYQTLFARITQTANLFNACGVARGDAVSLLLPNLIETHLCLWGAEAVGIANPVNPLLEPAAIIDILKESGSKVLVTTGPALNADLWRKAMAVAACVPCLTTVVAVGGGAQSADLPGRLRLLEFSKSMAQHRADSLDCALEIRPDDTVAYFHTGGTTGTPKLAQHSQRNECFEAWYIANSQGLAPGDVCLCGLPLFHVNAVLVSGLGPFVAGAHVVLLTPLGFRDSGVIQNFWRIVADFDANFFSAVPTVYGALLSVPQEEHDISSLRFGICGAAPMPRELIQKVENTMGLKLLEGYGLTEGTCVSSCNPIEGERKAGSIGLRIPYQEMRAAKLDSDGRIARFCGEDEVGVIVIKGPNVFKGYKQAEKNAGVLLDGGWLNTGDLGRVDGEGYVWLTGRAKDLIIRGGHNIDPGMIEGALSKHPAVQMVAAVGQPDAYAGELPVAYVQLVPGFTVDADELMEFARVAIPERAAVPVRIEVVDALPLTAVGKTFKPALRRQAIAYALEKAVQEAGERVSLHIEDDDKEGTVVRLASDDASPIVRDVLGRFPFKLVMLDNRTKIPAE